LFAADSFLNEYIFAAKNAKDAKKENSNVGCAVRTEADYQPVNDGARGAPYNIYTTLPRSRKTLHPVAKKHKL